MVLQTSKFAAELQQKTRQYHGNLVLILKMNRLPLMKDNYLPK